MIETLHRLDFGMILLLEWSLELCNEWMGIGVCVLGRNCAAGICRAVFCSSSIHHIETMAANRFSQFRLICLLVCDLFSIRYNSTSQTPEFKSCLYRNSKLGVAGRLSLLKKLIFSLNATYSLSAYPSNPSISLLLTPLIRIISAAL